MFATPNTPAMSPLPLSPPVQGGLPMADLSDADWRSWFHRIPTASERDGGAATAGLRPAFRASSALQEDSLPSAGQSIPLPCEPAAPWVASSAPADGTLAGCTSFVVELVNRWNDRRSPILLASYAADASLQVDFQRREVRADAGAWERLQARRELPQWVDPGAWLHEPSYRAKVYGLEALVWAVGLASAHLPLLGAPAAWRNAGLRGRGWQDLPLFSRAPVHLHLAELVSQGETTPKQLRSASHVDERELRAFLQAGLFLRLLEWSQ